jgi:hypothetical protein
VLSTQTAGAKIKALPLPVNHNDSWMDIGFPPTIGMSLGMTDRITERWGFPTNIALQNRYSLTIFEIYSILY